MNPRMSEPSAALVVGILIGTYSSVFVASPIVVFWHNYIMKSPRCMVLRRAYFAACSAMQAS
ncbi:MAG: hypothetical protein EXQ52_12820 [Bryobacterales bacterium]|nr:hypothetical protein [Bryobacterales bacterium]